MEAYDIGGYLKPGLMKGIFFSSSSSSSPYKFSFFFSFHLSSFSLLFIHTHDTAGKNESIYGSIASILGHSNSLSRASLPVHFGDYIPLFWIVLL